jgi:hypothetical protein
MSENQNLDKAVDILFQLHSIASVLAVAGSAENDEVVNLNKGNGFSLELPNIAGLIMERIEECVRFMDAAKKEIGEQEANT